MDIIYLSIKDIKPYEKNPRQISQEAIEKVANSIREFGFKVPAIVDKNNVLVCGHTRFLAAKKLGLKEIPCVMADDLTEEQIRAFRIADNKTGEFSEWDLGLLNEEIDNIFSLDMTDFGLEVKEDLEEMQMDDEAQHEIEKKVAPEVPFATYIDEQNNYVVLKFNTVKDWNNIQSVLGLKKEMALSTRKDGEIKSLKFTGLGRVVDGVEAVEKIVKSAKELGL